jgi:hypothetical protein
MQVFQRVAQPLVLSTLQGFNSTIFAYGQTGSGKTFTITGGAARYVDRGIIPRTLSCIFKELAARTDTACRVSVSYLEIYNEVGYDLLDPSREVQALEDLPQVRWRVLALSWVHSCASCGNTSRAARVALVAAHAVPCIIWPASCAVPAPGQHPGGRGPEHPLQKPVCARGCVRGGGAQPGEAAGAHVGVWAVCACMQKRARGAPQDVWRLPARQCASAHAPTHPDTPPSPHLACAQLFLGDTNRTISETPMNQASSRSHCIFTISLEARRAGSDIVRHSKLHLVDLAGSERVAKTGAAAAAAVVAAADHATHTGLRSHHTP